MLTFYIQIVNKKDNIYKNTSLAAKGALANRLQRRTACKIQNGRQEAPKWRTGSGKECTPRFLGILREKVVTEKKMEKIWGKKRKKREKKEKTNENSGHYIVCQQSTARTTAAGTPHARAKTLCFSANCVHGYFYGCCK